MAGWTTIADYILNDDLGFQGVNVILENQRAIITPRWPYFVGGSRRIGYRVSSYTPVADYLEFELDGTKMAGLTVQVIVQVKTENAGTSITPKVRNITDASDADVGTASTSTTWAEQTLAFVPVTGVKKYRVEIIGSNANADIYAIAHLQGYGA